MNGGPRAAAIAAALVLAAVFAVALGVLAWTSLQREQARPVWGALGTRVSVLLKNEQDVHLFERLVFLSKRSR
jgi:hypothetical protein